MASIAAKHASQASILRTRRLQPAFLETVLPGLVGGVASAMVGYPLELAETTLQATSSSPDRTSTSRPAPARRARCAPVSSPPPPPPRAPDRRASSENAADTLTPQEVLAMLYRSQGLAGVFRGADMALASAVFGFGAFFAVAAIAETLHPCSASPALELLKNVAAASVAQVVNSPFQLLKTTAIIEDCGTSKAFSDITRQGSDISRLWTGVEANMLGVGLVAAQFTLFRLFVAGVTAGCDRGLSPVEAGLFGSLACLGAGVLAYPGVALKTLVMAGSNGNGEEGCQLAQAAKEMWEHRRVYIGFTPFLVRSVPPTGLLFAVQRFVEQNSIM